MFMQVRLEKTPSDQPSTLFLPAFSAYICGIWDDFWWTNATDKIHMQQRRSHPPFEIWKFDVSSCHLLVNVNNNLCYVMIDTRKPVKFTASDGFHEPLLTRLLLIPFMQHLQLLSVIDTL
jgi:hypothetical protein